MAKTNGSEREGDLLTAAEVGARLRLPLSTVYYLAKAGKLRGFRVGRSWRFASGEIDRVQNGSGPLVLVVDDDESTRKLVVLALEPRGCHVEEAAGVDEALGLARHKKYDVLFVDLKMPGRDGTDLIKELDGAYARGQMVMIPALRELADGDALEGIGAVTLLPKPLTTEGLVSCVERAAGVELPAARGKA